MPNAMGLIPVERRDAAELAAGRRYRELAGEWPTGPGYDAFVLPRCDCEICARYVGRILLEADVAPGWYSYDAGGVGNRTHAVMTDGRVLYWPAWASDGDRPAEAWPSDIWRGWDIPHDVAARAAGLFAAGVNDCELRSAAEVRFAAIVDPPAYRPPAYTATVRRTRSEIPPVPLPLPG